MTGAAKWRGSFDGDGAIWMHQVALAARSLRVEVASTRGTASAGGRPERRPLGRAAIHANECLVEMAAAASCASGNWEGCDWESAAHGQRRGPGGDWSMDREKSLARRLAQQ